MSDAHNPYATPKAELHTTSSTGDGPWRDAKLLVVRRFPTGETPAMPHRCLKCNQPGTPGKLKPRPYCSQHRV